MKIKNPFFKKKNHIKLSEILNALGKKKIIKDVKINNLSNLNTASSKDISFVNNLKYLDLLKKSEVKYVICNEAHYNKIKNFCFPIIVKDVLKSVYEITELFYPKSFSLNFYTLSNLRVIYEKIYSCMAVAVRLCNCRTGCQ